MEENARLNVMRHRYLKFDSFELDVSAGRLFRNGSQVSLLNRPFDALVYLASRPLQVVSRQELMQSVWRGLNVEANSVDQAIHAIRAALSDDPKNPRFVKTVYGQGYAFLAEVSESDALETDSARVITVRNRPLFLWVAGLVLVQAILILLFLLRMDADSPKITNSTTLYSSPASKLSPLVTDGARIFYEEKESQHYRIASLPDRGGSASALALNIDNPDLCDISADGKSLVMRSVAVTRDAEAPFYLALVDSQRVTKVGNLKGWDIGFSSDGKAFFYISGNNLYRCSLNGANSRFLTRLPGRPYWVRSSPDGRLVRVTVTDPRTHLNQIWETNVDGSNPHVLFPGWTERSNCCGNWTPDGRNFIFQATAHGVEQTWMMPHRWSPWSSVDPVQLTFGAIAHRGAVAARRGSRIFARTVLAASELLRFDANERTFVPLLPGVSALMTDFDAKGTSIAYTALPDSSLWRSHADGSDKRLLTGKMQCALPRWSPNGESIAFMGRAPGKPWQIYTIPSGGGERSRLLPSEQNQADPDWSPNGSRLCFGSITPIRPSDAESGISILTLKTHAVTKIPHSADWFSPRWSPSGDRIAALSNDGHRLGIYDFGTEVWTTIATGRFGYPRWSRDAKFIYFLALEDGPSIDRVSIGTRHCERIVSLASVARPAIIFGDAIGLTPGDIPICTRDLSLEQIVALEWTSR